MGIAESIFDTTLSGTWGYEEDRREQLSVFAPDKSQTNTYSASVSKTLPIGTEIDISFNEQRIWNNSPYSSFSPAHTPEFSVDMKQPLAKNVLGYVDRRTITVTGLAIKNSDLSTKDMIEELIAKVERRYWILVFQRYNLEIYQNMLKMARELNEINKKNYDLGRIEKGDLYASEANVVIRGKDLELARNRVQRAGENIKLLMNIDDAYDIEPTDELEYKKVDFSIDDCLMAAFEHRRDYKIAKRDIEIHNLTLQMRNNEIWPEVDLVSTIAANGIDSKLKKAFNNISSNNNMDYYIGVDISMPIENNKARSEYRKAKYRKEKAIVTLKNTERAIVTEVTNAFRDYVTYETTLFSLMEASKLQGEKLKEEQKNFNYGRSNTKRLIDYQNDYLLAQLEVSLGILELNTARVDLKRAINVLLSQYEDLL